MATYRKKLDQVREARGLTVKELAHRAGIGVNTASLIINGHRVPYQRTISKLATALQCTPADLGFGIESEVAR